MPPKAKKGQGKAPKGFFLENRAEDMVQSVALASIPSGVLKEFVDCAKLALVVGEGKLSEQSYRCVNYATNSSMSNGDQIQVNTAD